MDRRAVGKATEVDRYIGARLKEARQLRRLSRAALCRRLKPPISWQQLQKYEAGTNRLAASRLCELAKLLAVSTDWLLPEAAPVTTLPAWTAAEHDLVEGFRQLPPTIQRALQALVDTVAARPTHSDH